MQIDLYRNVGLQRSEAVEENIIAEQAGLDSVREQKLREPSSIQAVSVSNDIEILCERDHCPMSTARPEWVRLEADDTKPALSCNIIMGLLRRKLMSQCGGTLLAVGESTLRSGNPLKKIWNGSSEGRIERPSDF